MHQALGRRFQWPPLAWALASDATSVQPRREDTVLGGAVGGGISALPIPFLANPCGLDFISPAPTAHFLALLPISPFLPRTLRTYLPTRHRHNSRLAEATSTTSLETLNACQRFDRWKHLQQPKGYPTST